MGTNDRAGHLKPYRWAKGRSGNPGGRPKGRGVTAALRALLRQDHHGRAIADLVAERLLREALSGKPQHLQMLLDRTEGKAAEHVRVRAEVRGMVLRIPPPRVIGQPEPPELP